MATAAAALLLGALFGFARRARRPERTAEELVPVPCSSRESPRERVEQIEKQEERIATVEERRYFGASLYTHNIQVSFLAFSLGALDPGRRTVILFYNGVILLGAVAGHLPPGRRDRSSSSPGWDRTARWSCRPSSSPARPGWWRAARCCCPGDRSRGAALRRGLARGLADDGRRGADPGAWPG